MAADGATAQLIERDPDRAGRALNRFTTVLLVGYLAFIVLFMVLRRAALSPDVFFVFVSVIAVMLGRGRGIHPRLGAVPPLFSWPGKQCAASPISSGRTCSPTQ